MGKGAPTDRRDPGVPFAVGGGKYVASSGPARVERELLHPPRGAEVHLHVERAIRAPKTGIDVWWRSDRLIHFRAAVKRLG